jgi:hypothetical protein
MQINIAGKPSQPLRAMIEIVGNRLTVYPIADSDVETSTVIEALRLAATTGELANVANSNGWR